MRSGMSVYPFCLTLPIRLELCLRWRRSLRGRARWLARELGGVELGAIAVDVPARTFDAASRCGQRRARPWPQRARAPVALVRSHRPRELTLCPGQLRRHRRLRVILVESFDV